MDLLRNPERLCNTKAYSRGAGALQNTDPSVAEAESSYRCRCKGADVEELRSRLARIEVLRYSVRTQSCTAICHVRIGLVVGLWLSVDSLRWAGAIGVCLHLTSAGADTRC